MTDVPFETLLFDVDGTLVDSNGAHAEAWTRSLREYGVDAGLDRIRGLIGMGGDKLLPLVAQVTEESERGQAIALRKKAIFSTLLPGVQATPGARLLLEYLRERGVDLVIATSADARELDSLLRQGGIDDLFSTRTSKDDAPESKPDPDIVMAALSKARAEPRRTALIGDTPYDIEAASRAGIGTIALRCGGHWSDSRLAGAMAIFDHPQALLAHWGG